MTPGFPGSLFLDCACQEGMPVTERSECLSCSRKFLNPIQTLKPAVNHFFKDLEMLGMEVAAQLIEFLPGIFKGLDYIPSTA